MNKKTLFNISDKLIAVFTLFSLMFDSYLPQLTYFGYMGAGYVCVRLILRINDYDK